MPQSCTAVNRACLAASRACRMPAVAVHRVRSWTAGHLLGVDGSSAFQLRVPTFGDVHGDAHELGWLATLAIGYVSVVVVVNLYRGQR